MSTKLYLKPFLGASKRLLATSPSIGGPLRVVTGNESADLDSITSSILYAYLYPGTPRPVPLIQIPREELVLRPELLYVLDGLQLSLDDLLCMDDADNAQGADIHLVDHNRLTWKGLGTAVRGIIDHHVDEGLYKDANPRVIDPSGSCSSLILETFFKEAEREPDERSELARLALGAVLIDTSNMTKKVTEHDEKAMDVLQKCMPEDWDRDAFYDGLRAAKDDVGHMQLRDLLRKDYKEYTEGKNGKLGISSVGRSLHWMKDREETGEFNKVLEAYGKERGLDVLCVMTTHYDASGGFHRQLLLWALQDKGVDCLKWFGEKASGAGMELKEFKNAAGDPFDSEDGRRRAWKQKNYAMSRKQVAPLLRDCLNSGKFGFASKV